MNRNLMKPMALLGTLILILSLMIGCGGDPAAAVTEATAAPTETAGTISGETSEKTDAAEAAESNGPAIPGLTFKETVPLQYAQCFQLYRYEGGYTLILILEDADYLVVPEGVVVP